MKASKDPKDVERYDTLLDVNMSCTAAVDILNDLLCYEKLDSGILTLHKEDVLILPFLNDCVSMFSAQARECGVTMSSVSDVSDVDTGAVIDTNNYTTLPLSLQPHDTIFVDKFKMDQVIRNLISNALKFTPRGGTVTMEAIFVPSIDETDGLTTSSISTGRTFWPYWPVKGSCHRTEAQPLEAPRRSSRTSLASDSIDGYLVVVVTDSGAGISAENQKRLFKDIVQFSPEKLQAGGGSGLGLWISGGIVDLHGGKINVHSKGENMGSTFTVEIPMVRVSASTQCQQHSINIGDATVVDHEGSSRMPGAEVHTAMTLSSPSESLPRVEDSVLSYERLDNRFYDVLVVDDSRLNRKMLLKCLQKDGHRCTEAVDGLEAVERVKQRMIFSNGGSRSPYDVILMDFIMPNMDGPTAVKEIRSMGYTAPIFGVTGNGK